MTLSQAFIIRIHNVIKSITQLKEKDLAERQDKLDVMIKVLMRKMDKLSTQMIDRHDIFSYKINEVLEDLLDEHFLLQMKIQLKTPMVMRRRMQLIMKERLVHTKFFIYETTNVRAWW